MGDTLSIVVITSVINVLLAAVILLRNPRAVINQVFGAFSLSLVTWTILNYLADFAPSSNLLYTRLTFTAAVFIALSLLYLSKVFPQGKTAHQRVISKRQLFFAGLILLDTVSPYLVPSVTKSATGVELQVGIGYPLYILFILELLIIIIRNFIHNSRRASKIAKTQIRLLLIGIIAYAITAIASNLLVPLVVDNWSSSKYGPIFTLIFVGFTAYAIVRHRLLDIRLLVARSIAYIFLLTSLVTIFVVGTFSFTSLFFSGTNANTSSTRLVYTLLALVLAFVFAPLKRFFDRLTAKLFYRDAYDPQAFLGQLNRTIINNIELGILLRHSAKVIEDNLKCEQAQFIVFDGDNRVRIVGSSGKLADTHLAHVIKNELDSQKQDLFNLDEPGAHTSSLTADFRKYNITVAARLHSSQGEDKETKAYLILGPKKSGNIYNQQDLRLINIISDELVIAIQNALRFEEIENFNVTLQQRINEATHKLRRANEKLKALDETKDDFISMASHQLRTPLTSAKGYISMVVEGDAGKVSEPQKDMLNKALFSTQRMVYLIADLLNVSRLKTGKFVIDKAPVNLATMVEQELDQLQEAAKSRTLTLSYEGPKNFPDLMLDETKTRQVVMNFIDNAIYYTPSGGHIKVVLQDKPTTVELKVVDDGIGVPKSEQPHLFTKFYRAGNARKARPDGTGLGLFMAKKVVVAQGGALIFESQEGKGSTFGFTFSKSALSVPKNVSPVAGTDKRPEPAATPVS